MPQLLTGLPGLSRLWASPMTSHWSHSGSKRDFKVLNAPLFSEGYVVVVAARWPVWPITSPYLGLLPLLVMCIILLSRTLRHVLPQSCMVLLAAHFWMLLQSTLACLWTLGAEQGLQAGQACRVPRLFTNGSQGGGSHTPLPQAQAPPSLSETCKSPTLV